MSVPTFRKRMEACFEPAGLLASSAYHFVAVAAEVVFKRGQPLALLFQLSKIRDEAFSRFWIDFSAASETNNQPPESNPRHSAALVPPLLEKATGTVLDIGPGSGTQMPLLAKQAEKMTRIYGAEPCVGLHDTLSAKATACTLDDKYVIMACSAEQASLMPALEKADLLSDATRPCGVFDTVICIRVLCSVPDPRATIQGLYTLLKPSGKMIICEHVVNPWRSAKGSVFARLLQLLFHLSGWSFFLGNCRLQQDTKTMLTEAAAKDGGWEIADLQSDFEWTTLPYISGVFVKKG